MNIYFLLNIFYLILVNEIVAIKFNFIKIVKNVFKKYYFLMIK